MKSYVRSHAREGGHPVFTVQFEIHWVPAFAGMTWFETRERRRLIPSVSENAFCLELLQRGDHFDGGQRRFVAFVADFATRPIDRLLHRLAGQHSKGDRDTTLLTGFSKSGGDLVIDVIVVRCLSLDDRSQTDHRVKLSRHRQLVGDQRQFERTRYADDGDVVVACSVSAQCVERAFQQSVGDQVVKPSHNDRDGLVGENQFAFDFFRHGQSVVALAVRSRVSREA